MSSGSVIAGIRKVIRRFFTYLERTDGSQVDLVAAGADLPGQEDRSHRGGIHAYLYGDTLGKGHSKHH